MPYINVNLAAIQDPSLPQRVANEVTELTARHLGKDPSVTAVVVNVVDPRHWFVGGSSLNEIKRNSFWLDIKVTDGTNTKREMADFIDSIFEAMRTLLGDLSDTSYAMVHSVPAAAWGYAGRTQEYRYISGRIKAETM